MDWIKRNLYFFVGSVVAVVLMGLAGFYLYSKWQLNNTKLEELNASYAELQRLNQERPHPGSGKIDNIATAKEQQQQLVQLREKARRFFERIPAEPDGTNVTSQEFAAALRSTIAQLQRDATNSSVTLPPDFAFSFTAQKPRVTFAEGTLQPLAVQLGEVKAICGVLFQAKINSLDNIRRERISPDDSGGPQTEYLLKKSVTNELAVMTPYELTFRCFSSELAAVLAGFGASPHGLLVKGINVEPAPSATSPDQPFGAPPFGVTPTPYPMAVPATPSLPEAERAESSAAFARRYGLGGGGAPGPMGERGGGGPATGGIPYRGMNPGAYQTPTPTPTPAPAYPQYGVNPATAASRGGLPTVLDEKQLKVTMNIDVVKLLPQPQK